MSKPYDMFTLRVRRLGRGWKFSTRPNLQTMQVKKFQPIELKVRFQPKRGFLNTPSQNSDATSCWNHKLWGPNMTPRSRENDRYYNIPNIICQP